MSLSNAAETARPAGDGAFSRDEPLVVVMRGNFTESVHRGSIAVANTSGQPVAGIGDVAERAFLRSGAKPFQVMPAVLSGGIKRFGITQSELAVLCSSHSGEPRQVEAVLSVLRKIGLDENALQCGVHAPLNPQAAADRWRLGLEPTPVCNNCSGAHAAMLTACVAAGWPVDDYGSPRHPLQRQIREMVRAFSGAEQDELEEAVDNCAVPTFRLPLFRSATAFARLSSGVGLPEKLANAADSVRTAMMTYPEMVGGENRFDTDLMRASAGEVVAKGGAAGFQGIGYSAGGIGLALKISDGDSPSAATACMVALSELGALGSEAFEVLAPYRDPAALNMRGQIVGRAVATFHLRTF